MLGGLDYRTIAATVRRALSGILNAGGSGSDGYPLIKESGVAAGSLWIPPGARAERIINGQIVESHAANAVTYTLKGKAGADLSATNPCYLLFPSATLTSGDFDVVKVTANIAVTVSSGSSLGHASNIPQHTFIYAINNAGVAELAVSNLPPDYEGAVFPNPMQGLRNTSTSAEGGAGSADNPAVAYSTTARSNVVAIPLAKVLGTQTTAGTWAASPTQIDMAPFSIPTCAFRAYRNTSGQTITTNTDTKAQLNGETFDVDSTFDPVTNFRHQPNVAGRYRYRWNAYITSLADGAYLQLAIYKNGGGFAATIVAHGAAQDIGYPITDSVFLNGTTDYVEFYAKHVHGSDRTMLNGQNLTYASGERVSP